MFSQRQLGALVALLALSLVFRLGPFVVLTLLLLLSASLAALWKRAVLLQVSYHRVLSHDHAFPDDTVELGIHIVNRKLLPISALHVQETASAGLDWSMTPRATDWRPVVGLLQRRTSLGPYEAVRWRYQIICPRRGTFRFGPTALEAGDPFGFTSGRLDIPGRTELVVYPRLLPLEELGLGSGRPLGDARAQHWLLTDPTRTAGARDYRFGDPLKSIHWPATARRGALQTRVYEPALTLELLIFLDLDTVSRTGEGRQAAEVERAISAAATVAQFGLAQHYSVGLAVNGMQELRNGLVRISPSRAPGQLTSIFDVLARIVPYSLQPMSDLLSAQRPAGERGVTVLLVSVTAPDPLQHALQQLGQHGMTPIWLYLGAPSPPTVPGVYIRHLPPPPVPEEALDATMADGGA